MRRWRGCAQGGAGLGGVWASGDARGSRQELGTGVGRFAAGSASPAESLRCADLLSTLRSRWPTLYAAISSS